MNFQVFRIYLLTQKTHIFIQLLLFNLQLLSGLSQFQIVKTMTITSSSAYPRFPLYPLTATLTKKDKENKDYNDDSDADDNDSSELGVIVIDDNYNEANYTLYMKKAMEKWEKRMRQKAPTIALAPKIKESYNTDWLMESLNLYCNIILILFLVASIYLCRQVYKSRSRERQLHQLEMARLEAGGLPLPENESSVPQENPLHQLIQGFCF